MRNEKLRWNKSNNIKQKEPLLVHAVKERNRHERPELKISEEKSDIKQIQPNQTAGQRLLKNLTSPQLSSGREQRSLCILHKGLNDVLLEQPQR